MAFQGETMELYNWSVVSGDANIENYAGSTTASAGSEIFYEAYYYGSGLTVDDPAPSVQWAFEIETGAEVEIWTGMDLADDNSPDNAATPRGTTTMNDGRTFVIDSEPMTNEQVVNAVTTCIRLRVLSGTLSLKTVKMRVWPEQGMVRGRWSDWVDGGQEGWSCDFYRSTWYIDNDVVQHVGYEDPDPANGDGPISSPRYMECSYQTRNLQGGYPDTNIYTQRDYYLVQAARAVMQPTTGFRTRTPNALWSRTEGTDFVIVPFRTYSDPVNYYVDWDPVADPTVAKWRVSSARFSVVVDSYYPPPAPQIPPGTVSVQLRPADSVPGWLEYGDGYIVDTMAAPGGQTQSAEKQFAETDVPYTGRNAYLFTADSRNAPIPDLGNIWDSQVSLSTVSTYGPSFYPMLNMPKFRYWVPTDDLAPYENAHLDDYYGTTPQVESPASPEDYPTYWDGGGTGGDGYMGNDPGWFPGYVDDYTNDPFKDPGANMYVPLPAPPTYNYLSFDLNTNTQLGEIQFQDASYSHKLSQAGSASFSLPVTPDMLSLGVKDGTTPGRTGLYVLRNDQIVWGGVIWKRLYDSKDRKVRLEAGTFESYFNHRFQNTVLGFEDVDQLTIARTLALQAADEIHVDVDEALSGIKRYYNSFYYEFKTLGGEIDSLASLWQGFDWNIRVYIDEFGVVRRRLVWGYPQLGVSEAETDMLFEYPGNIRSYTPTEDADRSGNRVWAIGGGQGLDQIQYEARDQSQLDNGWPLLETSTSYKDVFNPAQLQARSKTDLNKLRPPVTILNVEVDAFAEPKLGTYYAGDWARFIMMDSWDETVDIKRRIVGYSVSVSPTSPLDQVTLEIDAGGQS